ncbi:hypothetical protein FY136_21770 [Agrobacterium tumefaciens]|uniref:hypothetical protein n=1 Tax=Agrobacterium tumefaciens TaxID=358 RepID=UPI0021D3612F|nr:hypothetical protein [Agrobacterium tumefaciens]UXT51851.1 hypothetical protein FY136_21770 [Agrobacterium tumefaciens]
MLTSNSTDIEREILLDALDEDAVLSVVENISQKFRLDRSDIFEHVVSLSYENLVEFYKYENEEKTEIMNVKSSELDKEMRDHPYEIFLARTDKTFGRLAEINKTHMA